MGLRFGCPGRSSWLHSSYALGGPERSQCPRRWKPKSGCSKAAPYPSHPRPDQSPALILTTAVLTIHGHRVLTPAGVVLISSETSPARVMNAAASAASQIEAWRHYSVGTWAHAQTPPCFAVPELGCYMLPQLDWPGLWRLWATRHPRRSGAQSLFVRAAQPRPRVLEPAASTASPTLRPLTIQAWPRRRGTSSCRASPRSTLNASSRVSRRPTR